MINFLFKISKDNAVLLEFPGSCNHYSPGNLVCGEFRPPVLEFPKYVHFNSVEYMGDRIRLIPSRTDIHLNESEYIQTLHIIEPVSIPLPDSMNPTLISLDDFCQAHLFYMDVVNQICYLSSISGQWKKYLSLISQNLHEKRLPLFNINVAVITAFDPENPVVPLLSPAETFFSTESSFLKGRKAMIILVSSNNYLDLKIGDNVYPTSKLPKNPKCIAQIATIKLRSGSVDAEESRFVRRLITVSINGGVAVDLLDKCKLKVDNIFLGSKHFSRLFLHLNNLQCKEEAFKLILDLPIGNLKHYLSTSSNEASYCGLFWNVVLNNFFRFGETHEMVPNHRLVQEWATQSLYREKSINSRKIDLVALIDFETAESISTASLEQVSKKIKIGNNIAIPILTVESSRYGFSRENMHKDFGKTLGLISANCVTLAHQLIELGRDPEEAIVYGILIGGTNIQLCTAHAVVTKVSVDSYEIHANLTSDDHWFMSLFEFRSPSQESCNLPCCAPTQSVGFESIQLATEPIDLRGVSVSENMVVSIPDDKLPRTPIKLETKGESFINYPINISCFKKLMAFVECIKARINLLKSDNIIDKSGRKYIDPVSQFYFSQANPVNAKGEIIDTPIKGVPKEHVAEDLQSASKNLFASKKSSRLELAIYTECAAYFPSIFPRIYGIQESEDLSLRYDFEKMLPFQSQLVDWARKEHTMFPFLKFALDCLFELHILHELIGVIHRDISPANIMFSEVDGVFKIFDFDLSIRKGDPSNNPSPGIGTKDFIAPESERFGVYNEASDVYSLGMVMFSTLIPLLDQMDISEDHSTKFICTVAGMIIADVKGRLSVIKAIEEFMALFCTLSSPGSEDNMESTRQRCQLLLLSKETSASFVKKPEPVPEPVPEPFHLKILHPAETIEKEIPSATSEIPSIEPKSHEI